MELVVMAIMMLVCLGFILKLACGTTMSAFVVAAIAACFVLFTCDFATLQSKAQISEWLQNPALMLDVSVLITVDVAFQILYCILSIRETKQSAKLINKILMSLVQWIPGIMIFPVLFAIITEIIFAFPGTDFELIGRITALVVFILFPVLAICVRWLIPEKELRLEAIFLINIIILSLGIVATVNGQTAVMGTDDVEWAALIGIVLLILVGGISGNIYYKSRIKRNIRKLQ